MRLLQLGQGHELVWSLDPDVKVPHGVETTEETVNAEGKPSREGRMIPASICTLSTGAVVWQVRPLTVQEYTELQANTKNAELTRRCVLSARVVGGGVYTGEALEGILEANGLVLVGDLAHAIIAMTCTPFRTGPSEGPSVV